MTDVLPKPDVPRNRKKKIGIFLGMKADGGGAFQYSLTILDAAASLPVEEFSVVALFREKLWAPLLRAYPFDAVPIATENVYDFITHGFTRAWWLSGLPMCAFRRISGVVDRQARTMIRQNCDLWIFPAQDQITYQIDLPALGTIHDLMHRHETQFPEVAAVGRGQRRDRHYQNMCDWAQGILVESHVGKNHVLEAYSVNKDKIHVLPLVAPKYIHSSEIPTGFDTRYPLPKKFLFYPAQFWKHKNHTNLVRAIESLKQTIADIHLVFVGSKKNAYVDVENLVRELGVEQNVHFLGYVPNEDIAVMYRRARALVMPTFFGPTNIPPLEAFVADCPVAISNIYGIPEQVQDAALLFDPRSVAQIAEALRRLWLDDVLCQKLVENGRRRSVQLNQEGFNRRFEEIVRCVLPTRGQETRTPT